MDNEVLVSARKITDHKERMAFMSKYFAQYFMLAEAQTYKWMRTLSPKNESKYLSHHLDNIEAHYDGGVWDFYELSNGGYFIAPAGRENYRVSVHGNYFDGLLSAETAGMIVTCFMLGQLGASNLPFSDQCWDYYHKLIEYARQREDYPQFRAAID